MLNHIVRKLSHSASRSALLGLLVAGSLASTLAHAQEFLSIKGNTVNIRAKPTTQSEIAWELINGYPVQVTERKGDWLKVKDFEGALGWVHKPLTTNVPHYLMKVDKANLRSGPGTSHKAVAKLSKYDIVQTLEKQGEWAKVRTADGLEGWISQSLGWGW